MSEQTLTTTDNRTGKSYTLPIENGTVRAMDLRKIKTDDDDFGLMTYDPALMNTVSTKSAITYIDGDKGILEYRGYPIEQLGPLQLFTSRILNSFWRAAERRTAGNVDT
jgi:citrate synthase